MAGATGELAFLQAMPNSICGDLPNPALPAQNAGHSGNSFIDKLNQMLSHLTEFLPVAATLFVAYVLVGWVFARQHSLRPNTPETPRRPPRLALA